MSYEQSKGEWAEAAAAAIERQVKERQAEEAPQMIAKCRDAQARDPKKAERMLRCMLAAKTPYAMAECELGKGVPPFGP